MPQTLDPTPDIDPSEGIQVEITARLQRIEQRLEALEAWRSSLSRADLPLPASEVSAAQTIPPEKPGEIGFDLALVGRTLIVLGGAYLLRAVTESEAVPVAVGVFLGLLYGVGWSLLALRTGVSRASAAHHAAATGLTSLPLIVEATTKFKVLDPWSAALVLALVSAIVLGLAARRRLHGIAWAFSLLALAIMPVLIDLTGTIVPFALYLTALGIATVWLGYLFEWRLLRWVVAAAADLSVFILCFQVATNRLPLVVPATAIAVSCVAIAAYLATFAVRTLVRQRDVVAFEIAQTIALLFTALGGAMWVGGSRGTLEIALALAMLVLAAGSYAVAFAFIPRHFSTPANFVFYSSLGLMLIVLGGAFIAKGLANSVLWAALALISGFLSMRYRKSSLALHAAVYLVAGFVGADLLSVGAHALLLPVKNGWPVPSAGAVLLFAAAAMAAGIRPVERRGSFELWTVAKVMILAELGWAAAALFTTAIGVRWLGSGGDPAVVAVVRTSVLGALTVLTAFASRYSTLSPGRFLTTPLVIVLAMKLLWEDFRVGRPATLFFSFAVIGLVLILTPRLLRRALPPEPAVIT